MWQSKPIAWGMAGFVCSPKSRVWTRRPSNAGNRNWSRVLQTDLLTKSVLAEAAANGLKKRPDNNGRFAGNRSIGNGRQPDERREMDSQQFATCERATKTERTCGLSENSWAFAEKSGLLAQSKCQATGRLT